MAYSEAMLRAIKKYEAEKVERLTFRVTKGNKEIIQEHAAERGESVNAFLNRAVYETMERDRKNESDDKSRYDKSE